MANVITIQRLASLSGLPVIKNRIDNICCMIPPHSTGPPQLSSQAPNSLLFFVFFAPCFICLVVKWIIDPMSCRVTSILNSRISLKVHSCPPAVMTVSCLLLTPNHCSVEEKKDKKQQQKDSQNHSNLTLNVHTCLWPNLFCFSRSMSHQNRTKNTECVLSQLPR